MSIRLAILGACLPLFTHSFINPSIRKHTSIPPSTSSVFNRNTASNHLVRRFLSAENDDDESKPPTPPTTPDIPSNEEDEEDEDSSPPSEETVEAERPRVEVSSPPPPPPPPPPKQQEKQVAKPKKASRSLTPDEQKLIGASGVGGLVAGAILGILIDIENPNIDLTMSPILPPIFGAVFVSALNLSVAGSDGTLGSVIRNTFGAPVSFIGRVITSSIDRAIDNAVVSAKNKVKETVDDIVATPGKIADEIAATPGRVADAAVETATEIVDEIKATPGRVADAAVETATEIADEIKATPGRVVKQTKQAVEDAVDDTLDAVDNFVDDVKAIPQKTIDGVGSALGVSTTSSPRPPLAPPSATQKDPRPPKELPDSLKKPGEKKPLIPNITSLSVPKINLPKPSADTPKAKVAPPKKKAVEYSFPSETPAKSEGPKFDFPKFGVSSPPKATATKPEVSTQKNDAAIKRKKEAEARAEAQRQRQEEQNRKKLEAAERAEQARLQKQQEAEARAEAQRQRQEEAAERRRIQEAKQQEKLEAQRQAAEQKRQQAEERKRQAAAQREQQAANARASLGEAKSRTTISLGDLFGGNAAKEESKVKVDVTPPKKKSAAPPGVPVLSNWKQNSDGSITGRISGSPNFTDGQFITTSPIAPGATENSLARTSSGSR